MCRGFFFFPKLKNGQFERSRGRQLLQSALWCQSHSIVRGFDWKCSRLFFAEVNFSQSSIFKSECYISFAPLQRVYPSGGMVCKHLCVSRTACSEASLLYSDSLKLCTIQLQNFCNKKERKTSYKKKRFLLFKNKIKMSKLCFFLFWLNPSFYIMEFSLAQNTYNRSLEII